MGVDEVARGEIEFVVVHHAAAVCQLAGTGCRFRGRQERLPDHPGIDGLLLECSARVGRRQERHFYVGVGKPGVLQRLDEQIVNVRAFVQRDFLALQVGDGLERAVLGDQDRFGFRRRRFVADIDERRSRGLREDRGRFTGSAEIDGPDIECLEELRPRRELGPLNSYSPAASAFPRAAPASSGE